MDGRGILVFEFRAEFRSAINQTAIMRLNSLPAVGPQHNQTIRKCEERHL